MSESRSSFAKFCPAARAGPGPVSRPAGGRAGSKSEHVLEYPPATEARAGPVPAVTDAGDWRFTVTAWSVTVPVSQAHWQAPSIRVWKPDPVHKSRPFLSYASACTNAMVKHRNEAEKEDE